MTKLDRSEGCVSRVTRHNPEPLAGVKRTGGKAKTPPLVFRIKPAMSLMASPLGAFSGSLRPSDFDIQISNCRRPVTSYCTYILLQSFSLDISRTPTLLSPSVVRACPSEGVSRRICMTRLSPHWGAPHPKVKPTFLVLVSLAFSFKESKPAWFSPSSQHGCLFLAARNIALSPP